MKKDYDKKNRSINLKNHSKIYIQIIDYSKITIFMLLKNIHLT